jgi:hypothetical protein
MKMVIFSFQISLSKCAYQKMAKLRTVVLRVCSSFRSELFSVPSGVQRRLVPWKLTVVSDEHTASIFRVEEREEQETSV